MAQITEYVYFLTKSGKTNLIKCLMDGLPFGKVHISTNQETSARLHMLATNQHIGFGLSQGQFVRLFFISLGHSREKLYRKLMTLSLQFYSYFLRTIVVNNEKQSPHSGIFHFVKNRRRDPYGTE